ncbi:hypothetical protein [Streptomyces sp. NPDC048521]|uniref:hypothetical protein n=1 Tax=Streptomyces sp. NPDC048521 TaxID=3365566 RepID=UPI003714ABE1
MYASRDCACRPAGFFGRPDVDFREGVLGFRDLHDGVRHRNLRLTARAVAHETAA